MPSYPLDGKHGRTTSGVTCHHRLWTGHTVERRQAWHAIIAFGKLTRSNDVGRGMTSPPLDSTHGRTTSGVKCQNRLWTAYTVERHRAWHAIITFGQHKRSNNVKCGMTSPSLDSAHGRQGQEWHDITALGQYTRSDNVGRGLTSPPLDNTHSRMRSGMT